MTAVPSPRLIRRPRRLNWAFAILAIIFGVLGFAFAAAAVWTGIRVLFWVFLVLFGLSLLGWGWGPEGRRPLP
jgi:hypothetical protein